MAKKVPQMQVSRFTATGMYAGLEFTLTFLLFLGLGYLVDLKLGTGIGFMANGAVVGFLVALYRLNRQGRRVMVEGEKELKEAQEAKDEEARLEAALRHQQAENSADDQTDDQADGRPDRGPGREVQDPPAEPASAESASPSPGGRPRPAEDVRTTWGADQRARLSAPEQRPNETDREGDDV